MIEIFELIREKLYEFWKVYLSQRDVMSKIGLLIIAYCNIHNEQICELIDKNSQNISTSCSCILLDFWTSWRDCSKNCKYITNLNILFQI